jgi:hypothetical protein
MRNPLRPTAAFVRRRWLWFAVPVVAVVVLAVIVAFFLDEPIRRTVVRQMNAKMKGYTAQIRKVDFHPFGFAVDFYDVLLVQDANPDPPVMRIERLTASVQWRALIHRALVADFKLVRPILYVDRRHFESEMKDPTPVKEHGWQDALQAMYPLEINEFRIVDGDVTYVEAGQSQPLRLSKLQVVVNDVRNVRSAEGEYPSPITAEAVVFDRGRLDVKGHADFLLEPYAGVKGNIEIADVPLDYFTPVLKRANLYVTKGSVTGKGDLEYSPKVASMYLETLTVEGLTADYHYTRRAAPEHKEAVKEGARAAQQVSNARDVILEAEEIRVVGANVGLVHEDVTPKYRVFLADASLTLRNFTNQRDKGYGKANLTGRFMGSGATVVNAAFLPEVKGPDFSVNAKVENTDLRAMNEVLRAHANLDVVSGVMSVYSELRVRNNRVEGYVKPLFKDLKAYDPEQDEDKSFGQKLKEKAVNVVGKILKNRPRKEVATVAEIAGPLEKPGTDTLQALLRLIENAFFKAILPGLEREVSVASKREGEEPKKKE